MNLTRSAVAVLVAVPLAAGLAVAEGAIADLGPAVVVAALPAALLLAAVAAPPRDSRDATGLLVGLAGAFALGAALLLGPGWLAGVLGSDALEAGSPPTRLAWGALLATLLLAALQAPRFRRRSPEASGGPGGDRNLPHEPG